MTLKVSSKHPWWERAHRCDPHRATRQQRVQTWMWTRPLLSKVFLQNKVTKSIPSCWYYKPRHGTTTRLLLLLLFLLLSDIHTSSLNIWPLTPLHLADSLSVKPLSCVIPSCLTFSSSDFLKSVKPVQEEHLDSDRYHEVLHHDWEPTLT